MAYIEQHRNKWRVVYREGGRGSKRHRESFDTEVKAKRRLREVEQEQAAEAPTGPKPIAWSTLVMRWQKHLLSQGRTERYSKDAADTLIAVGKRMEWASAAAISLADTSGLKEYHKRVLRACLRWARDWQDQPVDSRVIDARQPKKRKAKRELISDQDVATLLKAAENAGHGTWGIAHMVATYGHRPESLIRLRIGAQENGLVIQGDSGRIRLMHIKGGGQVSHPLTPQTVAIMKQIIGKRKTGPAFIQPATADSKKPEPWETGHAFSNHWAQVIGRKLCKTHPGIYELKRWALTRMVEAVGIERSCSITGQTPAALMIYLRSNEARQREAVDAIAGLGATGGQNGNDTID